MKRNKIMNLGFGIVITIIVVCAISYIITSVEATEKKTDSPATLSAGSKSDVKPDTGKISYPHNAPQLSSIKVAAVSEVSIPIAEAMNGKIAYDENVTARVSSPVLGRVLSSHVEAGDKVAKNQSLAELDSPDLATADADWAKAKADEQRKKLAFDRAKNLFEHEVIARKDFESAEADFLQAVAETKRCSLHMRNLNAVGNENGKFSLKAPIAGLVADKQINPGMEVRPDAPNSLFVISDLSKLWVLIDVPERYIASIHPGQKMAMSFDAYPDQLFDATVDRVGLALDPNTRRIQVRGVLSNHDQKLRPEMFARISFLSDSDKKAIKVPNTSLIAEGLYSYVFVEKKEGEFQKQRVNVVRRGQKNSYVDSGLNAGQRIVTEGSLLLNAEVASHAQ
ncbi:efflux RND transporter periplasmic adaptor subunit [Undibacterium sp. 5I1]|uniref:efflux RND transporter periplasmic adaptor subunit n=1 Tax=Undibacterium sp. 5I1 TaxID=3048590 RepID=UPI002AB4D4EE|nr:efflux RND transporter periplasmic adaptor subunit [Undibacterium sp. 5I1]MDY7537453.1 efflux RND transporter periplasmic adaptor subunit [Undibacterium sp. 5I1]